MRHRAKEVKGSYTLRGCFSDEGLTEIEELAVSSRRTWGGRLRSWFLWLSPPALFTVPLKHPASESHTFGLYLLEETVGNTQSRTLEENIQNGSISNVLLGNCETHLED